jgi:hypothetical protein
LRVEAVNLYAAKHSTVNSPTSVMRVKKVARRVVVFMKCSSDSPAVYH